MVHRMDLNAEPFEMMRQGSKDIELRLWDEKRRRLQVGDEIVFTRTDRPEETLRMQVALLHCFRDFGELYRALDLLRCGYDPENVAQAAPEDMEAYYTRQEQERWGVVGIELRRLRREIRQAGPEDAPAAGELAARLWDHNAGALAAEFRELMAGGKGAVFLAEEAGQAVGFAQVQLRTDYVEGTESSPVGYLEGLYVAPQLRRQGVGRGLVQACQAWARARGCREFASDCELENQESQAFHRGVGFTEANRVVCFVVSLEGENGETGGLK